MKSHERLKKKNDLEIVVFEQSKNGKANAVWEAIERAKYDSIAILDADISVDPEELTSFFEVLENTNSDFVNGTRLMYPMEDSAMRYINKLGNRSFQYVISKVIGINLSDTLCGTKIFKRSKVETIYNWQKRCTFQIHFVILISYFLVHTLVQKF